jgi:bacterioferritin-associated ferredoxin
MILCICKNISDSKAKELLKVMSLEDFQKKTGCSTQCRSCEPSLKELCKSINLVQVDILQKQTHQM